MSGGKAGGMGGLRRSGLILGGLLLAAALGFPVGQLAGGLAFVAFAMGALCLTVGLKDAARAFLGPGLLLIAAALAAPMVQHLLGEALSDPRVRLYVVVAAVLLALAGLVLLLSRLAGHGGTEHRPVRPTVRRRTTVRDPEPVRAQPERRPAGARRGPAPAQGDDDLDLFTGGRHGRR